MFVYYLKINTNGKWMVAVITWYLELLLLL